MKNTRLAKTFIGAMVAAGVAGSVYAGMGNHTLHLYQALALLALAAGTSRMKVKLPGIDGNMSMNLPFLLMAVVNLSAIEAVLIACVSTAVQCWPKAEQKFKPQQMLFNLSMMAFAASMASLMWHAGWRNGAAWATEPFLLASAAGTFFLGQTAPVAAIIKLTDGAALHRVWMSIAQLSFPYFVISAGVTSMTNVVSHHVGWQVALIVFPLMYAIHCSYRLYFGRATEMSRPLSLSRAAGAGM